MLQMVVGNSFCGNLCLVASNNMVCFCNQKLPRGAFFNVLLIHIHSSELLEATQRKSIKRVLSKNACFAACFISLKFLDSIFLDLI